MQSQKLQRIIYGALIALAAIAPASAQTNCYGTGSFRTCTDLSSGNSYSINRIGNLTTMEGSNPRTGSRWSMQSNTIGNTTFNNGTASNGAAWNSTVQDLGGVKIINSTDSRGRSKSITCTAYGCF